MSPDVRPLYGELVIPFNTENKTVTHAEALARVDQLRIMINDSAYFLAEKRGFVSGHELEDWVKAELEILRNLK